MRNGMSCSEAGKLGVPKTLEIIIRKKKERINKYNLNPNTCIECNKQMLYEQRHDRFCSQSCSTIYNNKTRIKTKKYCLYCKKEFKNKSKIKFCSRTCYKSFIDNTHQQLVESGKANYRTVKRYLLNKNGNKCSQCGLTTWQNVSIPLVLDHKDGDYSNNTPENCRLLCNNCDALTTTYKGRNKGNGRFNRRQRYNAGKSY